MWRRGLLHFVQGAGNGAVFRMLFQGRLIDFIVGVQWVERLQEYEPRHDVPSPVRMGSPHCFVAWKTRSAGPLSSGRLELKGSLLKNRAVVQDVAELFDVPLELVVHCVNPGMVGKRHGSEGSWIQLVVGNQPENFVEIVGVQIDGRRLWRRRRRRCGRWCGRWRGWTSRLWCQLMVNPTRTSPSVMPFAVVPNLAVFSRNFPVRSRAVVAFVCARHSSSTCNFHPWALLSPMSFLCFSPFCSWCSQCSLLICIHTIVRDGISFALTEPCRSRHGTSSVSLSASLSLLASLWSTDECSSLCAVSDMFKILRTDLLLSLFFCRLFILCAVGTRPCHEFMLKGMVKVDFSLPRRDYFIETFQMTANITIKINEIEVYYFNRV